MKLENRTDWDTAQLKAMVREVAKREMLTAEDVAKLAVKAEYCRRGPRWEDDQVRGRAYRHSWRMRLGFVKGAGVDKAFLARTVSWALAYNQGVQTWRDEGWRDKWAWAAQMPLERRPEKEPGRMAPDEAVAKDMERCLGHIVAWEQKEKLARTKLRVWKAKLAYYTRKLRKVVNPEGTGETA